MLYLNVYGNTISSDWVGCFLGWFEGCLGLGLDSVLSNDTLFVLEEEIRILILHILLIFTFSPFHLSNDQIIGIICT